MSVEQVNVPGNWGDVNIFLEREGCKTEQGIPKNNSAGTSRIDTEQLIEQPALRTMI
jgi:hypothetical protein